jgi:hypothetical protein
MQNEIHVEVLESEEDKITFVFTRNEQGLAILYLEKRAGKIVVVAKKLVGDKQGGEVRYSFDGTIQKVDSNFEFVNPCFFRVWNEVKRRWHL